MVKMNNIGQSATKHPMLDEGSTTSSMNVPYKSHNKGKGRYIQIKNVYKDMV